MSQSIQITTTRCLSKYGLHFCYVRGELDLSREVVIDRPYLYPVVLWRTGPLTYSLQSGTEFRYRTIRIIFGGEKGGSAQVSHEVLARERSPFLKKTYLKKNDVRSFPSHLVFEEAYDLKVVLRGVLL